MNIINYFLIAVALSMDAFSVALSFSFNQLLNNNKKVLFIILVGILHFIMPLIGSIIGYNLFFLESISKYILAFIFLILGIEMIISKESIDQNISFFSLILVALTVSIDSLTIGVGLSISGEYNIIYSLVFSIASSIFTFIGIMLGKLFNNHLKKYSKLIGVLILFVLAFKYFFNI